MNSPTILSFFILSVAVVYVFIYPSYQEVSILMSEKARYEDFLVMARNVESKTQELQTKFNKISVKDRKSIDTVLPDSLDLVKLVSQIDGVASRQGIRIDQIVTREIGSFVGDSVADAQPQNFYKSAIIGFSFSTSYSNFENFVESLEKSLRILDARSVKITPQENGSYLYTLEFEVYWLKS